nr:hypothetical protein [Tanacetum cinerariifolium]
MHSNGMARFKELESHLRSIYQNNLAFHRFLGEEHQTFKLQSKDVQINSVQAVKASLVVTKSSEIESKYDSSENAHNKSVNETHMQVQEGKVDMGKALNVGLVVKESNGTKSNKHDTSSRSGNYITHDVDADIRPVNAKSHLLRVYNRRIRKIIKNMNVTLDELLAMAFKQLTPRTAPAAAAPQGLQTLKTSTIIADIAPTPTNTSSQPADTPNTS